MTLCILSPNKPRNDGYVPIHTRLSEKKYEYAHRLAYTEAFGEIPTDMTIDHLCKVRNCINPEHLEVVTLAENTRRAHNKKIGDNACGHKEKNGRHCKGCEKIYRKTAKERSRLRSK